MRRWKTPASYISTAAVNMPRRELHLEHVVPIRVLVDRMIMEPTECQELLETAVVIAHITPAEHRELGGIFYAPPRAVRPDAQGACLRAARPLGGSGTEGPRSHSSRPRSDRALLRASHVPVGGAPELPIRASTPTSRSEPSTDAGLAITDSWSKQTSFGSCEHGTPEAQ